MHFFNVGFQLSCSAISVILLQLPCNQDLELFYIILQHQGCARNSPHWSSKITCLLSSTVKSLETKNVKIKCPSDKTNLPCRRRGTLCAKMLSMSYPGGSYMVKG